MAIYMLTTWVSYKDAAESVKIGSKITKMPPYIKKWRQLATPDRAGAKSYNIIYVDDDKIAEAGLYIGKLMNLYWDLEGFAYTLELVASMRDTRKMFDMELL